MLEFLTRWASLIPTISAIGAFAGGLILTALGLLISGVIIAAFGLLLMLLLAKLSNQQALAQQAIAHQANQQGQQAQTPQQIVVAYPPERSNGVVRHNNNGQLCPNCNTPISFSNNYCPYCGRSTFNQITQNETENE